jgi:cysteinyl-tRNA synthetase
MQNDLKIYNTYEGKMEEFEPLNPPFVGIYLCGPTVYGHPHLGHCRGAIHFDLVNRYLTHLGYKVRYVRNITDVGHLVNDADEGEDKIQKMARLEQLEPMEVAQFYTNSYHDSLQSLNLISPSIEPRASGHIQEQVEMIEGIMEAGYAYEVNGSVYFDVIKYNEEGKYGKLSGRKIEDLIAGSSSRDLEGQSEKRNTNDFALWKKADESHIMKWKSPWSLGYPGWHIECSAMSNKYLGKKFDIHGGGMDLLFPHHESEIAQSVTCNGVVPAKYWMHNNMITINGQKMAKSLNNGILLHDFFKGNHELLDKAYTAMILKFFVFQAHYRSTLDFSNQALQASEKGLAKLFSAMDILENVQVSDKSDFNLEEWKSKCLEALNDDFNTPVLIANLFLAVKFINSVQDKHLSIDENTKSGLMELMKLFVVEILGLENTQNDSNSEKGLMELILDLRNSAKENKDYNTSDKIRDKLAELGFVIKDGKEGTTYAKN